MHELDITRELIKQIGEAVNDLDPEKEKEVTVELGKLSTFCAEPMRFYYDQLTKDDSMFQNISLNIIEKEAKIKCRDCGEESSIDDFFDKFCRNCGGMNTDIIEGRDVLLKTVKYKD